MPIILDIEICTAWGKQLKEPIRVTTDQKDKGIPIILEAQKMYSGYTVPVTYGNFKNAFMMHDKLARAPWNAATSKPNWRQHWITAECSIENITNIINKTGDADFPIIHIKPMTSPGTTNAYDCFKPTPMSKDEWEHIKDSIEHYEQFGRIKAL